MLEFCVAAIAHVAIAGDFRKSSVCARYVEPPYTVGGYLNSNGDVSLYASYTIGKQWFVEAGIVTGYFDRPVPMARAGYNFGRSRIFIVPAYHNGDIGAVIGWEITL